MSAHRLLSAMFVAPGEDGQLPARHVGAESANDLRVLEDGEVVEAVEVNLNRHCPESFGETRGRSDRI